MAAADFDRAGDAADWLRARGVTGADVAIVLGSGLGAFADRFEAPQAIAYDEIPHWPSPTVVGHAGRLVAGRVAGRRVLGLAGRVHAYEGHPASTVTFAMRVLGRLGVPRVILTNAAGGINTRFAQGALMVIDDHINLSGHNPLVGPNDERFGPRFPDMSEVYSRRLRGLADEAARAAGLDLEHGVYVAVLGPSYETPAEIRAFRALGADAVGMSTVPEAIVAAALGMECAGVSCITNHAAGITQEKLDHAEVVDVGARASARFCALVESFVEML